MTCVLNLGAPVHSRKKSNFDVSSSNTHLADKLNPSDLEQASNACMFFVKSLQLDHSLFFEFSKKPVN